jgi:hypothetical protein
VQRDSLILIRINLRFGRISSVTDLSMSPNGQLGLCLPF